MEQKSSEGIGSPRRSSVTTRTGFGSPPAALSQTVQAPNLPGTLPLFTFTCPSARAVVCIFVRFCPKKCCIFPSKCFPFGHMRSPLLLVAVARNVTVAATQYACGDNLDENVNKAETLVRQVPFHFSALLAALITLSHTWHTMTNELLCVFFRVCMQAAKEGANIILIQELFQTTYFCQEQRAELFQLAHDVRSSRSRFDWPFLFVHSPLYAVVRCGACRLSHCLVAYESAIASLCKIIR